MSTMDQAMNYLAEDVAFRQQYQNNVSVPFTPPCNGFLIATIRATSTTGRAYDIYSGTWPGIVDGYSVGQMYTTVPLFVRKGVTVTRTGTTNVSQRSYYFIPLGH